MNFIKALFINFIYKNTGFDPSVSEHILRIISTNALLRN